MKDLIYWIWLSQACTPDSTTFTKLISKFASAKDIYDATERDIRTTVGANVSDCSSLVNKDLTKAKEIYGIAKEGTIADDSGLCIDCLDGFPGVMTHRFLGEDATDRMRNEYLIKEVNKHEDRSAQFICNMVYYDGERTVVGEGILNGVIARECRGENGFGFDEIFELPNGLTLAELSSEEKNEVSSRTLALKDLRNKLNN
jgi:XTP/dITP diphosphohydrolase